MVGKLKGHTYDSYCLMSTKLGYVLVVAVTAIRSMVELVARGLILLKSPLPQYYTDPYLNIWRNS